MLYYLKQILASILLMSVSSQSNQIDLFAQGLQDSILNLKKNDGACCQLLGPQLIGKQYKNQNIIIDSNQAKNIYQVSVINQSGTECGFHADRNGLYIAEMIQTYPKNFDTLYGDMLDQKKYADWNEAYAKVMGCSKNEAIPNYQNDSLKKIFDLQRDSFPKNQIDTTIHAYELLPYQINETYEAIIHEYEKNISKSDSIQAAAIASAFKQNGNNIAQFRKQVQNNDYIRILRTAVLQISQHAITLVLHKHNNVLECLVANSFDNQKFSTNKDIKTTIDTAITLYGVSDQEFNIIATRSICLQFYTDIEKYLDTNKYIEILKSTAQFIEDEKNKDFDKKFYEKYYKDAITKSMDKVFDAMNEIKTTIDATKNYQDQRRYNKLLNTVGTYMQELFDILYIKE